MLSLSPDDIAHSINSSIELALARAQGFERAGIAAERVGKLLRAISADAELKRWELPRIVVFTSQPERYPAGGDGIDALIVGPDDSSSAAKIDVAPDVDSWAARESEAEGAQAIFTRTRLGQTLWAGGGKLVLATAPDPCVFATGSHRDLADALDTYGKVVARKSMCGHLSQCWKDPAGRVFVRAPEAYMRDSLWQYLRTTLRFYVVDREFTVGAEKPVDVMVDWQQGGQRAFVEVKWLGRSETATGNVYAHGNPRAVDGAVQLRDRYVEPYLKEHPDARLLGYLAVFDARAVAEQLTFPTELTADVRLRL